MLLVIMCTFRSYRSRWHLAVWLSEVLKLVGVQFRYFESDPSIIKFSQFSITSFKLPLPRKPFLRVVKFWFRIKLLLSVIINRNSCVKSFLSCIYVYFKIQSTQGKPTRASISIFRKTNENSSYSVDRVMNQSLKNSIVTICFFSLISVLLLRVFKLLCLEGAPPGAW